MLRIVGVSDRWGRLLYSAAVQLGLKCHQDQGPSQLRNPNCERPWSAFVGLVLVVTTIRDHYFVAPFHCATKRLPGRTLLYAARSRQVKKSQDVFPGLEKILAPLDGDYLKIVLCLRVRGGVPLTPLASAERLFIELLCRWHRPSAPRRARAGRVLPFPWRLPGGLSACVAGV